MSRARIVSALLVSPLLLALVACAPLPQGSGVAARWQPSPNFDERRPNFVILHQTGSDAAGQALRTLTDPLRRVSAHYLIARDGTAYQLVDERARAWHAGESYWGGLTDLNSASIGIELDNNGEEPFAEPQLVALLALLSDIRARYRIPAGNFLGHGDVAPRRKVDPSRFFPWKRLAEQGFGLWCETSATPPPGFAVAPALQALGYDVANAANATNVTHATSVEAAALAFRRHFVGDDATAELSPDEQALLHCLVGQKAGRPDAAPPAFSAPTP